MRAGVGLFSRWPKFAPDLPEFPADGQSEAHTGVMQ
jgi:hypothetical protein